jgi:hypothetical protein
MRNAEGHRVIKIKGQSFLTFDHPMTRSPDGPMVGFHLCDLTSNL